MTTPPDGPVLPTLSDLNRPFWEACAAGQLVLQVCEPSGHIRYPISEVCPRCLSPHFHWQPLSGRGEILSWVVFRRAYHPFWAPLVPYVVALVQLREGPRMFGNVVPLDRQDIAVGDAVQVTFERLADDIAVPRWTPVPGQRPRDRARARARPRDRAAPDGRGSASLRGRPSHSLRETAAPSGNRSRTGVRDAGR
ncbi:MAG: Zn-ribbon domain-containing OB-fold protein [Candidatus Limnocylindrales bacterium]